MPGKPNAHLLLLALLSLLLGSCATIFSTAYYPVPIRSEPTGAHFVITDRDGLVTRQGTTPTLVQLRASNGYFRRAIYRVELTKEGYNPSVIELRAKVDPWYWGNVMWSFVGFLIVDPLTGAMYRMDERMIHEGLERIE